MTAVAYELQGTLLGAGRPEVTDVAPGRRRLDATTWIDTQPAWLHGSDEVFAVLAAGLEWSSGRRPMYDRIVDVPRLTASVDLADPSTPTVLTEAADRLSERYGRTFDLVGAALYRDGHDSVAWHGDKIRHHHRNPIVALLVLGAPRPFLLRPAGGGSSIRLLPGGGDLLVMGGRCQLDWEHTVPKIARAAPRMSIAFRHGPDA